MNLRTTVIGFIGMLYGAFWRWYTPRGKPLSAEEVEQYTQTMAARGADPAVLARIRAFLATDTGRGFIMANLIKLHDTPVSHNNAPPEPAAKMLNRYSSAFLSRLLRRGGHPVLVGRAAAQAVELWGLPDEAAGWSTVGVVRYRSRRDMIEATLNRAFSEEHPFKTAAIERTVAFPADPYFQLGDPRLVFGLVALILALLVSRFGKGK